MLAGHNRMNAAKLAGFTEIPAFVKENLSDEGAYVYVTETNLMQRSFMDLLPSEKAAVLAERYDKVLYQRKREDIINELKDLESGKKMDTFPKIVTDWGKNMDYPAERWQDCFG